MGEYVYLDSCHFSPLRSCLKRCLRHGKSFWLLISILHVLFVVDLSLSGTYSLSELRYIVYSLAAYERQLSIRIRRLFLLHPVESNLPTWTRSQRLWLEQPPYRGVSNVLYIHLHWLLYCNNIIVPSWRVNNFCWVYER